MFISAVPGEKKTTTQQNNLTALHNVTIQIMERTNHRNQHKDKDATILNAVSGKMRGDPEGDSPRRAARGRVRQKSAAAAGDG